MRRTPAERRLGGPGTPCVDGGFGKTFVGKNTLSNTLGMKITTKGQVTIPQSLRRRLGLLPGTEVRFEEAEGCAVIRPLLSRRELIEERIRRATGIAGPGSSTDEIMRLTRGED